MKGTGLALAVYELSDEETKDYFDVTVIQFDDEQVIIVEDKKTKNLLELNMKVWKNYGNY